jgi:hypothetical protein
VGVPGNRIVSDQGLSQRPVAAGTDGYVKAAEQRVQRTVVVIEVQV